MEIPSSSSQDQVQLGVAVAVGGGTGLPRFVPALPAIYNPVLIGRNAADFGSHFLVEIHMHRSRGSLMVCPSYPGRVLPQSTGQTFNHKPK